MTHGGSRLINLAVVTFTIVCMLLVFAIAWIILHSIRVPAVLAFPLSTFYSLIPVFLFVYEEIHEERMISEVTSPS